MSCNPQLCVLSCCFASSVASSTLCSLLLLLCLVCLAFWPLMYFRRRAEVAINEVYEADWTLAAFCALRTTRT